MAFEKGDQWENCRILNKLGQGGNCEVYKVTDLESQKTMALKMLLDKRNVLRFRREFRSMQRLDHGNIAKVYAYKTDNEKSGFTMEFISGGDLKSRLSEWNEKQGKYTRIVPTSAEDFRNICRLFIQILSALHYIHSQKILHRDLKPANIMLTETGKVKLMDFGLLKDLNLIQESITASGAFVGTVNYMSPEQGLSRKLDHRSDLYSLGVIMYEMLTGRLPFTGENIMDIFMKHIQQRPVPPNRVNADIPDSLNRLVVQLLDKQPAHRPVSAEAVISILTEFIQNVQVDRKQIPDLDTTIADITITDKIKNLKPGMFAAGMIGRDNELSTMQNLLNAIDHIEQRVVMISGEMGIGKTKLVNEFAMQSRLKGYGFLKGICTEIEQFPFGGLIGILETLADWIKSMPVGEQTVILEGRGQILNRICPRFSGIKHVSRQSPPVPLAPLQEKLRNFDAIRMLMESIARKRPTLFVVEDLQWADELTLQFLLYMARNLALQSQESDVPLILCCSYRIEDLFTDHPLKKILKELERLGNIREMPLKPFDYPQVLQMVRALLDKDFDSPELIELLYNESGGNPFFIEEIIKNLIDRNLLSKKDQTWSFSWEEISDGKPFLMDESITTSILPIPERINEMISRRLDKWDVQMKRILSEAAVIGMRFDFDVLATALSVDEDDLLDILDIAIREELLSEVTGTNGQEIQFHSKMVRNVLYNRLQHRRRTRMHKKVAEILLQRYGDENPEIWDVLAYHYDNSHQVEAAVQYYLRAANFMLNTHSHRIAREYAMRVIELTDMDVAASEKTSIEPVVKAYQFIGISRERTGEIGKARKNFEQMITLARKAERLYYEALGYYQLGGIYDRSDLNRAMTVYQTCLELLDTCMERTEAVRKLRINTLVNIAAVLMKMGKYKEAEASYLDVLKMISGTDMEPDAAACHSNLGNLYYYIGDHSTALKHINSAIEMYQKTNDLYKLSRVLNSLSALFMSLGKPKQALDRALESLDIAEKIGDIHSRGAFLGNLGVLYQDMGRLKEAAECYCNALDISQRIGDKSGIATTLINIANVRRDQGDDGSEPPAKYKKAIKICNETGELWLKAYAMKDLGMWYLMQNNLKQAETATREGADIAHKIGLVAIEIQCRMNLVWIRFQMNPRKNLLIQANQLSKRAVTFGDSDTILHCWNLLAKINIRMKQFKSAWIPARQGLKESRKRQLPGFQWRFYASVAYILQHKGRKDAALQAYMKSLRILNEIFMQTETKYKNRFFQQKEVNDVIRDAYSAAAMLGKKNITKQCIDMIKTIS